MQRHDGGYSATVEGYFVLNGERIRLAKTNGSTFVFAAPRQLPQNTEGDLLVIIDGKAESKRILVSRVFDDDHVAEYRVLVPF